MQKSGTAALTNPDASEPNHCCISNHLITKLSIASHINRYSHCVNATRSTSFNLRRLNRMRNIPKPAGYHHRLIKHRPNPDNLSSNSTFTSAFPVCEHLNSYSLK